MRRILLACICGVILMPLAGVAAQGPAGPVPRPASKTDVQAPEAKPDVPSPEFLRFIESLWPRAQARGVSRETFDLALRGVTPDPRIAAVTQKQSEFAQPIWAYLDGAVTAPRLQRGRDL